MPATVPPAPTLIEILTAVLVFLAASLPVAIGITVAFLLRRRRRRRPGCARWRCPP
ncbi:hypothetical protein H7H73_05775, partial [Mycobacterium rufum]|nr:hypothetical protein [Mycolicibacterium rufum]